MVDDLAAGIETAGAGAWVLAALVDAGLELAALRADDALRPAGGRAAHIAGLARAHGQAIVHTADTVGSAR